MAANVHFIIMPTIRHIIDDKGVYRVRIDFTARYDMAQFQCELSMNKAHREIPN